MNYQEHEAVRVVENFTAIAVGNNVQLINQWGGKKHSFNVSGTILSTPIISGKTVNVLTQTSTGQKMLGIYNFSGGKIGGRYV